MNLARNKYHWNRRRGEGVNISMSEALFPKDGEEAVPEMELPDVTHSPDRLIEKIETQSNVLKGIESLPETLREAMILRHVKDMPYEQIASVLDCKIGTVKSRIARGRELLREYLLRMDAPSGGRACTGTNTGQDNNI